MEDRHFSTCSFCGSRVLFERQAMAGDQKICRGYDGELDQQLEGVGVLSAAKQLELHLYLSESLSFLFASRHSV